MTDESVKIIEGIVCEQFTILPEHLRMNINEPSKVGHPKAAFEVTDARHFLWYILYSIMGYEASSIAREYGVTKRAIFNAINKIQLGIKTQPFYANNYRAIQEKIRELNIV